jgi:hypothetical protein
MRTVFACVNHDVLVLRSSVADGGPRLLANSFEGEPRERALARAEAASRYALQVVSGEALITWHSSIQRSGQSPCAKHWGIPARDT